MRMNKLLLLGAAAVLAAGVMTVDSWNGMEQAFVRAEAIKLTVKDPTVSRCFNVVQGIHIFFELGENADQVDVFRTDMSTGERTFLGSFSGSDLYDNEVESGVQYKYDLYSSRDGVRSDTFSSVTMTFVYTPDIIFRANTSSGIKIGWEEAEGASGYAIFRKDEVTNGEWERVVTIDDGSWVEWLDTESRKHNGTVYHYAVRALADNDGTTVLSGCRTTGRTMVRLFTPTVSSCISTDSDAIRTSWNRNDQADGYELRFMVGKNVVFQQYFANNKTVVKTINDLKINKFYKIQVRSRFKTESSGTYYSAWSAPKYVDLNLNREDMELPAVLL